MQWLNYQHLYYFWQIARCGSMTAASCHLRLAQPTISAQLKSLETTLGEKLFERAGRKLKLTEAGQIANRYAEQIFNLGSELIEILEGKTSSHLKELRIGIADVVPKSLAYRLIAPALNEKVGVTVSCLEDKTERLLADLSIGEIELVIADRPIPPNIKVKAFNHFVGECGVSFLATKEVASKLKRHFPHSLARASMFMPTSGSALYQELGRWFDKLGMNPSILGMFQDRALMKIAAREGRAVIPVPSVIENEVKKEFHLELVGRTNNVKEQIYLISIERRLKNPIIMEICLQGQNEIFQ